VAGVSFARFGVAVGHATDIDGATGLTVVRGVAAPLRAGSAVLGRASGTRDLLAATPGHLADRVDALLLTGGSAYGLDAAAGVMRWMEEHGRGLPTSGGVVPIVPAAVVFDLSPLGRFDARPTPAMAYAACEAAAPDGIVEGSVGAGAGCTVGKALGSAWAMKGGVGCAVAERGGAAVGALAVVNALGDVRDADGQIVAGARTSEGGFADGAAQLARGIGRERFADAGALRNTTLAVVMTDTILGRVELAQLAAAAGAAMFRRITPAGTTYDGDVVFALCPLPPPERGAGEAPGAPPEHHDTTGPADDHRPSDAPRTGRPLPGRMPQLEALAVEALERAIERAVRLARGRDGVPGLADASDGATGRTAPPRANADDPTDA
jgi:L-aminopeptidase/D-esterase-like protein